MLVFVLCFCISLSSSCVTFVSCLACVAFSVTPSILFSFTLSGKACYSPTSRMVSHWAAGGVSGSSVPLWSSGCVMHFLCYFLSCKRAFPWSISYCPCSRR